MFSIDVSNKTGAKSSSLFRSFFCPFFFLFLNSSWSQKRAKWEERNKKHGELLWYKIWLCIRMNSRCPWIGGIIFMYMGNSKMSWENIFNSVDSVSNAEMNVCIAMLQFVHSFVIWFVRFRYKSHWWWFMQGKKVVANKNTHICIYVSTTWNGLCTVYTLCSSVEENSEKKLWLIHDIRWFGGWHFGLALQALSIHTTALHKTQNIDYSFGTCACALNGQQFCTHQNNIHIWLWKSWCECIMHVMHTGNKHTLRITISRQE